MIEQLKAYCDCVDVREEDVEELIHLVSVMTCWAKDPCETFLKSERMEVIDLPECVECGAFEFIPFYAPFDAESFTFTLVKTEGINETAIPISDFSYSEMREGFLVDLPLPDCRCLPCKCGCQPTYKLLVRYDAGYEGIPDCLLPLFCDMLKIIREKNNCDCSECQTCGSDEIVEVNYTEVADMEDRLKGFYMEIMIQNYKNLLGMISLCQRQKRVWGFVV